MEVDVTSITLRFPGGALGAEIERSLAQLKELVNDTLIHTIFICKGQYGN